MNKQKIVNDPVHGFISIRTELAYELIAHPYYQRLRNIRQLGLTHLVYPGACHTRFQHALGAMHLMGEAITQLRQQGFRTRKWRLPSVPCCCTILDTDHSAMRSSSAS